MAGTTPSPVSMADVAHLAGVSMQTVSRVANDSPAVREDTRRKVRAAMDELGYRPNSAARSLKRGEFRSVGLVMFDIDSAGARGTLKGIASAAASFGLTVTLVAMDPSRPDTLAEASRRMVARPVDGMIFNLSKMVSDFETFRPQRGLTTVIRTALSQGRCSTVENDQYGCGVMATELLLDHGHGDVRFVAGPRDSVAGGLRQDGWRDALLRRGIEPLPPIRGDWTADSGYEAGIKIAADRDCTAVFAANDSMACGVMMALRDSGLRVPEDVSIVGVDDALVGLVPRVSLTTVRFRDEEVGMRAVQMALGKDPANAGGEIADVRVSADLVIRDTVADRR